MATLLEVFKPTATLPRGHVFDWTHEFCIPKTWPRDSGYWSLRIVRRVAMALETVAHGAAWRQKSDHHNKSRVDSPETIGAPLT